MLRSQRHACSGKPVEGYRSTPRPPTTGVFQQPPWNRLWRFTADCLPSAILSDNRSHLWPLRIRFRDRKQRAHNVWTGGGIEFTRGRRLSLQKESECSPRL